MTSALSVRRSAAVTGAALVGLVLTASGAAATAAASVPGAPRSVAASPGNATATVTWTAPATNGGSAVTGYTATCASGTGPTGSKTVGNVLTATVTGLTNGASYTCTVKATNAVGTGAASAASAAVTPVGPPTAPRNVTVATGAGTLTSSWQAPTGTGGAPLSGYAVACTSTDGGAALSGTTSGTVRTLALTGLADNRTYKCKVTATGPGGTSPAGTSPYAMHASVTSSTSATMHLPVTATQSISSKMTATTLPSDCNSTLTDQRPDGTGLGAVCSVAGAFVDGAAVGGAGTAMAVLASTGPTGTAELVAYVFADVTGTITPNGPAVTTTTTVPGQNSRLSFSATAGQQVTATITANTLSSGAVSVYDPSGGYVGGVGLSGPTAYLDTVTLPVSGTYTVRTDPSGTATGKLTVKLSLVPANTGTITLGTATTITVGTPGQNPTRTFTGAAGQMVVATVTGNTIPSSSLTLTGPGNTYVGGIGLGGATGFLDTLTLPTAGTYTLTLDPNGQDTGALTLKAQNVPANTGTTTPGTATSVTASLGQNPTRTFSATAGQTANITITANTIPSGSLGLYGPDGGYIASVGLSGATGFLDTVNLLSDGTYTVKVDPNDTATGGLTFKVVLGTTGTGGTTLGGPAVTITAAAGQNPTRTFTGNAGQMFTTTITGNTIASGALTITQPDGSYLGSVYLDQPSEFLDTLTLPVTGTYTITVDPYDTNSGKLTVKTGLVPANTGTLTIGTASAITAGTIGQNPTRTFTGTAGQQITATVTGNTIASGGLTITQPDGTYVGSAYLGQPDVFLDTVTLPVSGTYTVLIDPYDQNTGQLTVKLGNVPANTGTLTIGTASAITAGTVGQNPTRTFTGTAGQQITATVTGNTIASGGLTITQPDGSYIGSAYLGQPDVFLDTVTLPVSGTYTVLVDPYDQNTGQLTVKLGNVPANTGTLTVGTASAITAGTVGQNPTRTFTGTAGQQITATITGNTIASGGLTITQPDGTYVGSAYLGQPDAFLDTVTLPVNGTYTVLVDPYDQNTGQLTVKLGNVPANTGTIVLGTATTVTVSAPGQNPTRTFSGTAGQVRTLDITANTVPGTYVYLYAPDGSYVSSTYASTSTDSITGVTLPTTGTYKIVVDPTDANTGQLTLKLHA